MKSRHSLIVSNERSVDPYHSNSFLPSSASTTPKTTESPAARKATVRSLLERTSELWGRSMCRRDLIGGSELAWPWASGGVKACRSVC
jgi:hypothetical protein